MVCPNKDINNKDKEPWYKRLCGKNNKKEAADDPKNTEQLNFYDQYFDYYIEMRSWTTFFFVPNQLKKEFYDESTLLKSEQKENDNLVKADFHMMNV